MKEFLEKWLFDDTIGKLVALILGIILVSIIVRFIQKKAFRLIKDNNQKYKAKKLSVFFGYLLVIVLAMVIYSNKLGGFTVALGVAGAGIAFALQEVIASVAGWMAIMFGGFFKTGDRVQLGGIKGDVIDIGVLRTTLMETGQWVDGDLYNGRIVLIANSFVFKEPVFNYSGDFPFLWDEIKIPVQYGSNYEMAKELFKTVAKEVAGDLTENSQKKWNELVNKYMIENAQTESMVTVVANDNWVEYTIRYVVDYKSRRLTKDTLFTKILTAVSQTNGEIRFASATFQLVEAPELKVKLSN
ncbi:MAG: mechanosensitive ion channel family protein [Chitinophagaceae bacterium]